MKIWTEEYHFFMEHNTRKNAREFIRELKKFLKGHDPTVTEKDLNNSIRKYWNKEE